MRALILAGGKGTRLRPLTVYTPKPIVPVVNRPFILYQLESLVRAGIRDVTLSLSYQPNKIEDVLGDGSEFGVALNFVTESTALGTAGAVGFAMESADEPLIVLNGDILTSLEIVDMIDFHRHASNKITIALARVDDVTRYGLVNVRDDGSVESFIEKPSDSTSIPPAVNTINAGVYILEPQALKLIAKGKPSAFEYDVFPAALEKGLKFSGYVIEGGYWRDIGTPESYLAAHHDILSGVAGLEKSASSDAVDTSPTAFIDDTSVLAEGCIVKPNAKIVNSVLGPGVHVDEKAVIENSVIWAYSKISTYAEIRDAVIGKGCHIGRNAEVRAASVIGDKAMIPDYSVV